MNLELTLFDNESETIVDMMSSLFDLSWEKGETLY